MTRYYSENRPGYFSPQSNIKFYSVLMPPKSGHSGFIHSNPDDVYGWFGLEIDRSRRNGKRSRKIHKNVKKFTSLMAAFQTALERRIL